MAAGRRPVVALLHRVRLAYPMLSNIYLHHERAPQAISPAVSLVHALMAKYLERTCQVRNRVRQSRTLGSGAPGELAEGWGCKSPRTKE